jgi:acyl-CoA thioester hydrolase
VSSELRGEWRDGWYVVPHHVVFRDLDPYGHVNNAVYLTYFEWARALLWFDLTGRRGPRDLDFIVARAECDFRRQLGIEPIEIATRVADIGTSSFAFVYEIRKNAGSEVAATGKVVVVLFDWARQSKRPIDDELRRKLSACSPQES